MSYRDDRDALSRRVENLEDDLRSATEELANKQDDGARGRRIVNIDCEAKAHADDIRTT